ncbi:hypothetical protein A2U01_0001993 [Trifolium medium]|uniref:Uncharacterized protein n=1 Tax=Trifolium medium TaxID=97028 RepID=A0A392M1U5_9FABA|nr:hypothetical protein [Trifolium medium]
MTLSRLWMGDLLGSFPESVQVRTKLAKKIRVGLWGHSVILKAVWGVTIENAQRYFYKLGAIQGGKRMSLGGHKAFEARHIRHWLA